jgi:hypothetical protein
VGWSFRVGYVLLGVKRVPTVLRGEIFELGIRLGDEGQLLRSMG